MSTATTAVSTLSSYEQGVAQTLLEQSANGAMGAVRGLSDGQWKFKPAPDQWSIVEIFEHIAFVQEIVARRVEEELPNAPPAGERNNEEIDRIAILEVPVRLQKYPAPEFAHPKGIEPAEALDRFQKSGARIAKLLASANLRAGVLDCPPLKALSKGKYTTADGYQWLLFALAHTDRHTKQILEVRANPGFPSR
ncbi:MAG TPA: DinB family protein [Bryobacteraceae bacterium]|jgi:hypothetical protein|nr:DinB family protein [Bryobacteraceae bacterium]